MICIDSRWNGPHGIGRFAKEVMQRSANYREVGAWVKPSHPVDFLLLTLWMLRHNRCIRFSPGYNAPLLGLDRYVLTVHDLNHVDVFENSSMLKRIYYHCVLLRACRKAARILTVSEFSRQRIIAWAGIEESQVVNVGNGVGSAFSEKGQVYDPGYRYVLCVGNRKPHKNEARLLRAFARAKIDKDIYLLFTGPAGGGLAGLAAELDIRDRVEFLGRVEEERLPSIYRGADALLFPSLYEGFGLPVVEAMACGIPVLTSNSTSLAEVASDAALLVEAADEFAICRGIERILTDDALRLRLVERGLERAKEFRWESVAERVQGVLAQLSAGLEKR